MIAFLEPNIYHKLSYTGFILKNSTVKKQYHSTASEINIVPIYICFDYRCKLYR